MTFRSKGKTWKQILRNAGILGSITMISNLTVAGGFSLTAIWSAFLAGALVLLIELKHAYNILPVLKLNKNIQKTFFLA